MALRLDKRAARLAVTRFGADPSRVRQAYLEALQALKRGQKVDLVEAFVRAQLLTSVQAGELREALDKTQIDPKAPIRVVRSVKDITYEVAAEPPPAPRVEVNGNAENLRSVVEYRRLRKLGEGGMGEVYLAYDESAERLVAIKILWPHLAASPSLVERFKREAAHTIKLEHANIVRGFTSGQEAISNRWYLVMEYVDGPSVQTLLDRERQLDIGDAVHIALDIAHALEYAHSRNIVHRDIKPENILITRSGVAKLADLGLSKATDQVSHLTATRQGFGTPYYMPYEQAMNAKSADGRSDLYALGATLYHMVCGQPPFQGENQVDILEKKEAGVYPPASLVNPKVPPQLDLILDKMLARDRRDRYQTASELIVDLERSGLAARVVSFVDRDAALQDPVVRARVAVQATQPDIQHSRPGKAAPQLWYVRQIQDDGSVEEYKATTEQVLQRIRQGRLNGSALASTAEHGEYRKLAEHPPFQEAIREHARADKVEKELPQATPVAEEPAGPPAWQGWFLVGSAIVLAALALLVLYLLSS
jgi:serine/threonine-protein kinase